MSVTKEPSDTYKKKSLKEEILEEITEKLMEKKVHMVNQNVHKMHSRYFKTTKIKNMR
jgi:hypothetical protein